ncbi:SDR family NAD(P)-dependent oxidoreductase [Jannaschia donghaensis]|uniref:3-oxoacyl-[acyl-carrier-protein] reductase FabG n=1 Tax=Jannaschia donghaensis TaxID=420998 RepID=A0A0M6YJ85_9RHOB|nr:SDR family NAD(P)-dependent oxidoreductase [Jannaschia donghaensis]CTQ50010.1 3-oxoacyl-[acyl-carrier-protein] reductase FabG [Jannaschia donghaensis]
MTLGDLKGRHALVTGGGTGIGRAIAEALLARGADVTVTGRRLDALRDVAGANPIAMDVTDPASVTDGIAAARAAHGPIQICIANAGIAEGASLPKTDEAMWRRIMATNLDGSYRVIRACLPDMADWGRVIAVSSIAGLKGLKGAPAYTASKHGMIGLIRGLAADHLGRGVTFNALCPGYVDTAIVTDNTTRIMDKTGMSEADARDIMVTQNPHRRLIEVDEVAEAALWLCSHGARSVNGQTIQIAGGEY